MVNTSTLLANAGFSKLTEMQEAYLNDKNYNHKILLAQTGSGKTVAYLLQLMHYLNSNSDENALILCPTRELAIQVHKNLTALRTGIFSVVCYGGHSFKDEVLQLKEMPQIMIGTPGRMLDHLTRGSLKKYDFKHWIFDEYDKLLEFGFLDTLEDLLRDYIPKSVQLISATEIEQIPRFLSSYTFKTNSFLNNDQPDISFFSLQADGHDKFFALLSYISTLKPEPSLIFCSHREATVRISTLLKENGCNNVVYHGGLEQFERETALIQFRNRTVNFMVCTDLAARGLDIPDIAYVFHYQFPDTKETFIHRNGRTARMKKNGNVILLHSSEEPLPAYCSDFELKQLNAPNEVLQFPQESFLTLRISAGRKDKIRKMDIVGFFMKDLQLNKDELGIIDVLDRESYVAITPNAFKRINNELRDIRIKNKKAIIRRFV
jgi:superfamily II DNA/RNA helicase